MPFSREFDSIYEAICATASTCGLQCHRGDTTDQMGSLIESMIADILLSDLIIADISRLNPNVLYELGIAHAFCKPTILLSQELAAGQRLPFDISQMLTVKYRVEDDDWTSRLERIFRNFLSSSETHSNPVEAALSAKGLRLACHFQEPFLWGYARTFRESRDAKEAWIISHQLYWERLDASFFTKILEQRILTGERRELVLMPASDENRDRKQDLLRRYKNIEKHLRILLLEDDRPLCFLPTEISIYDPGTTSLRAILLEPMAQEGTDSRNDAQIASALASDSPRDLQFHNLREVTFDIALSRTCSEGLSHAFRRIWNEVAKPTWRI
jgi:hypothetical protein